VALLLLRGLTPVLTGAVLGLFGAAWASAGMRGLLYDVGRFDLAAFAGAVVALALVAAAAGLVPARRVASVDPLVVLREGP
jgi:putative ABC transport system permease protein